MFNRLLKKDPSHPPLHSYPHPPLGCNESGGYLEGEEGKGGWQRVSLGTVSLEGAGELLWVWEGGGNQKAWDCGEGCMEELHGPPNRLHVPLHPGQYQGLRARE